MTESQIREKVVATAKAWIGYNEADGSHRQIVDVELALELAGKKTGGRK